jgi:hypothetical protein
VVTVLLASLLVLALGANAGADAETLDRLPYKISAHVAIAPSSRIDAPGRERLLDGWRVLTERLVGAPWDLSVAEGERAVVGVDLETIEPEALTGLVAGFDKVWLIQIGRDGAIWTLAGRELDTETKRLGPCYRRVTRFPADLPRALLDLAQDVFRPSAALGTQSGGGVTLTVRGASLRAATPFGQVVAVNEVFRPIRFVKLPDGTQRILDIPFTYLRIESLDGAVAHCAIHSAMRDPLTRRIAQKSTILAIGSEPGPYPTRLRFLSAPDKAPAAGYVLTARPLPDGVAQDVGTTDREGRIVLAASETRPHSHPGGLLALRLIAGSVEPVVEFPLMPGESAAERLVPPFDPRSLTVALETRLDSLRDSVIDLVAIRARLEARLKARLDGEDLDGAQAVLDEFARLPSRDTLAAQLTQLKENAASQQARLKMAVLTKTAQAEIAELDALIARYLEDDAFRALAEALAKARSDAAARVKATTKPKR